MITTTKTTRVECDSCGKYVIFQDRNVDNNTNFTTVKHPYGGYEIHICPDCLKEVFNEKKM